jgi:hypothetical protein
VAQFFKGAAVRNAPLYLAAVKRSENRGAASIVVTRNTRAFSATGAELFDPFAAA